MVAFESACELACEPVEFVGNCGIETHIVRLLI
jgi:hypothetical protein